METTRFDSRSARGSTGKAPASDSALFGTGLAFALAMLSLLAVLAFADATALVDVAPFFAVPALLFITSGVLFAKWVEAEAHEPAAQEAPRRQVPR